MLFISILTGKSELRKWATDFVSGSTLERNLRKQWIQKEECICENKIFKKNGIKEASRDDKLCR